MYIVCWFLSPDIDLHRMGEREGEWPAKCGQHVRPRAQGCCRAARTAGSKGQSAFFAVSFLHESGSDSGSCYFRQRPSRWQLKLIFSLSFFAYFFLKLHLHHFSKIKSHKEVAKQYESGFSYNFCLMKEGSGSVPHTNGSGSGKPKNRNTAIWWSVEQVNDFIQIPPVK